MTGFENLKLYQKRSFVPPEANLLNVEEIKGFFKQLLEREILCQKDLEQWIFDRSELEAALDQEGSILYIRMTCQTDDPKRAEMYKNFIENIPPAVEPLEDVLNQKHLEHLKSFSLDRTRYEVYNRAIKIDVELFRDENVALEKDLALLSQEYQTISGAMTVFFNGEEKTLPQMGQYLLEPDRALRESAWRETAKRRLKDKDRLEEIFQKMVELRHKIAQNAGYPNYSVYKFQELHRFDYTPKECKSYHAVVEKEVLPLWIKILNKRRQDMKLETLRPWDLAVDVLARPPLKPFERVEDLIEGCRNIFRQMDPQLGEMFLEMSEEKLLDLESRKGKAPGGYQSTLNEFRKPFIFMNAVGIDQDVRTLLHESGHAFHALLCAKDPLVSYRHAPMEFCEVASMSMELLGGNFLSQFYPNTEDLKRSHNSQLEDMVSILVWVAIVDAFQFWIYENPKHSPEERKNAWLAIRKRFSADTVDWSGLKDEESYLWHRQLHIFEVPFYYIEYAIAQLGALQIWFNSKNNWDLALRDYKKALSFGGARPLPELFKAAGIRFDFSRETIAPLVESIGKDLAL
ncbi:MAG: M3 family oligoendopeptidase [Candidatus Omnitrophica bacterium]|nr:M3 family oligoendopeptidase [Candidatus Omnitrophota bacterium]